jgi:hypothetical protein
VSLAALGAAGAWVGTAAWLGRLVKRRPGEAQAASPLPLHHKETLT